MKISKKVFMASLAVITITTSVIADEQIPLKGNTFGAITWSPNTKDGTIEGYNLKGSGMIGIYGGKKDYISDKFGLYGSFDASYNKVDDTQSSDVMYSYRIFNVGATYTPMKDLTLMGGVGYSMENAEFMYYGENYRSIEDNDQINFNVEAMYNITDDIGLIAGYNTAPEAFNVGVSFSF